MEKTFKDYAHLYLGCEVYDEDCPDGYIAVLDTVDTDSDCYINYYDAKGNCESDAYVISAYNIKPILRPLSDATLEESNIMGRIYDINPKTLLGRAEQINYLLKQGFDLFGLIDAGIAIDATTLKS